MTWAKPVNGAGSNDNGRTMLCSVLKCLMFASYCAVRRTYTLHVPTETVYWKWCWCRQYSTYSTVLYRADVKVSQTKIMEVGPF